MTSLHDRVAARLKDKICSACVMTLPDGSCGLPRHELCPIFAHLDDVIATISQVDDSPSGGSDSISPYAARLRQIVCAECFNNHSGQCNHRDSLSCALDAYFPLVVEIIEEELEAASGSSPRT